MSLSHLGTLIPLWLESNGCLKHSGQAAEFEPNRWYLLTDRDVILHPHVGEVVAARAAERPEIDIFYCDEVVRGSGDARSVSQLCKPAFDRTQIVAQDYIGWPIVVRGKALTRLGGPNPSVGTAVTYDLILRAMSEGIAVERITEVLALHRRPPPRSSAADRALALDRWRRRSAPGCEILPGIVEGTFQLRRRFVDPPTVTLIIPTRQAIWTDGPASRHPMIVDLLESIRRTNWPLDRLTVLIGDDVEDGNLYKARRWPFRLHRIVTSRPDGEAFNYAIKMNRLWPTARTEHLVFMNDDLVARNADWLVALMTFAVNEDIGGVGARLLYPNDTIQHVGMPAGVLGPCTHAFVGRPAAMRSYQNWAEVHREWSIVTGAVFATRRSLLEKTGGFDERFSLDFNDVDLCLRLRLLGYRIVYAPVAEFTHYESASRRRTTYSVEQIALFMERWQDLLKDDPAYHPRLTRSSPDIAPVRTHADWWVPLTGVH